MSYIETANDIPRANSYIKQLQSERDELRADLEEAVDALREIYRRQHDDGALVWSMGETARKALLKITSPIR